MKALVAAGALLLLASSVALAKGPPTREQALEALQVKAAVEELKRLLSERRKDTI